MALRTCLFQPPLTPVHDSTYSISGTRKRTRQDSATDMFPQPSSRSTPILFRQNSTPSQTASPAALANSRYQLDGGFDTPTLAAANRPLALEDSRIMPNYRSKWSETPTTTRAGEQIDYFGPQGALERESNGRGRPTNSSSDASALTGLSQLVLGVVGGVAGKVWDFCRNSAFRGFYAGSGQGYSLSRPSPAEDNTSSSFYQDDCSTPVPGQYPRTTEFLGDFDQDDVATRPAKRLHTDSGNGWVMVDHHQDHDNEYARRESSPRLAARKTSSSLLARPIASRTNSRHSVLKSSLNSDPTNIFSQVASPSRRASVAPTRSPSAHHRRRSTHYQPSSSSTSHSPQRSRNSPSNTRRTTTSTITTTESGRRDNEVTADRSMQKLSRQVQDLIRQGQAALGTRFEVEDHHLSDEDGQDLGRSGVGPGMFGWDGRELSDEGFESGDGWEEMETTMSDVRKW